MIAKRKKEQAAKRGQFNLRDHNYPNGGDLLNHNWELSMNDQGKSSDRSDKDLTQNVGTTICQEEEGEDLLTTRIATVLHKPSMKYKESESNN